MSAMVIEEIASRQCAWGKCGQVFQPKRRDSRFCSTKCAQADWVSRQRDQQHKAKPTPVAAVVPREQVTAPQSDLPRDGGAILTPEIQERMKAKTREIVAETVRELVVQTVGDLLGDLVRQSVRDAVRELAEAFVGGIAGDD